MNKKELLDSIKANKWSIWKYFRMIYWTIIFILALYFTLLIVLTLFV